MKSKTIGFVIFASLVATESRAECVLTRPTPPGTIDEIGYTFTYQSGLGEGCIAYRLWNRPGGLYAPVLWTDEKGLILRAVLCAVPKESQEALFDRQPCGTKLDGCYLCKDTTVLTMSPAVPGSTNLTWGANWDQFGPAKRDAFRPGELNAQAFPQVATRLEGTVADAQERDIRGNSEFQPKTFAFSLRITCSVVKLENQFRIKYDIDSVQTRTQDSSETPYIGVIIKDSQNKIVAERYELTSGKSDGVNLTENDVALDPYGIIQVLHDGHILAESSMPVYRKKD